MCSSDLQGALAHKGTAILDVLSPCVTFNNHEGSTKSLKNIKYNLDPIHDIDFIPPEEDIKIEYDPGSEAEVELFDGSRITLAKLKVDYDPTDRTKAVTEIQNAINNGKFLTGLIYYDDTRMDFAKELGLGERSLSSIGVDELSLTQSDLDQINKELMK